jgi:hypothetical protein
MFIQPDLVHVFASSQKETHEMITSSVLGTHTVHDKQRKGTQCCREE